ncbi:hypothetical protein G3N55_06125, partial [Dissulfurirhabdus thermomarina]
MVGVAAPLLDYAEPVLEASSCRRDRACFKARLETAADLSPLLPYANARVKVLTHDPEEPVLVFRHEGYRVALRPHEVAVGVVADLEEGRAAVRRVVDLLNDLWARRNEIPP